MTEKTCCIAGHREIPEDKIEYVKGELRREVDRAIEDGYIHFLTDLLEGVDQLFAAIVAEKRLENSLLRLEALLPYRSRYEKLFTNKVTKPLLQACTDVGVACEKYTRNCYMSCRRKMLERSSRMIVVYDGRERGGTVSAIRMAHIQEKQIREIML